MTRRAAPGFSLLELLVVMVLFAVGLFTLLPSLRPYRSGPRTGTVEAFVEEARREAVFRGELQRICFRFGNRELTRGNATLRLESPPAAASLDGERVPGAGGCFAIYPSGLMDSISLRLASGAVYRSTMLTGRLEAKNASRRISPSTPGRNF